MKPVFLALLLLASCTKPIDHLIEERALLSEQDSNWLYERLGNIESIELTLDEAIDFALDYNLELKANEAEIKVAGDLVGRELIQMLPNLEINAINTRRSNIPAAGAESVLPLIPHSIPSFSSIQTTAAWDANFSWNILNTGIQYFRAKELKNAQLVRKFIYQRTAQNIILDVVSVYWLVAVMQETEKKLQELTEISRDLAKKLHEKVDEGHIALKQATDVIGAIYYQQVQAKLLLQSYQGAPDQLKVLLGIPPCIKLIVRVPEEKILPEPLPPPCLLHKIALNFRPELYQIDTELAIHEDELREAILTIFPQLTPFIDYAYDGNPFLVHNYWLTAGFRVLYNLLSIPLSLNSQQTAEDRVRESRAQRVFLSISILSQIHIAYARYLDALDRFKDARIYWIAKKNAYDLALAKKNLNAIGDLEYVFPLSDLGFAEAQMNLFYVEMMGYLEQISNAIGIPRYFTEKYGIEGAECL